MSIFSKINLVKKQDRRRRNKDHVGGMEDFMTLIRVYYQSVMACNIGITNINFLPDMAVFKRTLKNTDPKTTSWELLRNHAAKRC